ncbi:hypothetical protein [uncultured Oscillibacter sp.]|uniref:hypothetical protein n=1 Tax=uncultured Oscillibacter sp. TaxID=876091 RepID=UPI0025D97F87|nr:hypothetical protein [uncultured Oscillibacter sp.]
MTIDFCKPWSDEECRLFLDAIRKRKTEYCEERGLPVPAFDKVEDFYIEPEMLPGHQTTEERLEAEQHQKLKELRAKLGDVLYHEPADSGSEAEDDIWARANSLKEALDDFFEEEQP